MYKSYIHTTNFYKKKKLENKYTNKLHMLHRNTKKTNIKQ